MSKLIFTSAYVRNIVPKKCHSLVFFLVQNMNKNKQVRLKYNSWMLWVAYGHFYLNLVFKVKQKCSGPLYDQKHNNRVPTGPRYP